MESNIRDKVVFASPKDEEERGTLAGACVRKLGIKIPAVLDQFGNATEQAYTAWPDRLYLIDRNGRVAYKSRPGPFGFRSDELRSAIDQLLAKNSRTVAATLQISSAKPR
jgi:type I thyroxine 5'-deiodinase